MVDVAKVGIFGMDMGTFRWDESYNVARFEYERKDLLECAALNNIKNAQEIIDQICEVASGWPRLAKECEVPQTMIDAIVPHLLLNL